MAATAVHNSFASCLIGDKGFFTSPKNRLTYNCQRIGFFDKSLKLASPLLDLGAIIAQENGSLEVAKGFRTADSWAKLTRDGLALINIFQGVIPGFVEQSKAIFSLCSALYRAEPNVKPRAEFSIRGHNEVAEGKEEIVAALISQMGNWMGALTFIIGFGGLRPIQNFEKYIFKPMGHSISPIAHDIGAAFPTVMMVNHLGAALGAGADMVFRTLVYDRTLSTNEDAHMRRVAYEKYREKLVSDCAEIAEKSLELVLDVVHHMGETAPAGLRIPAGIGIGLISVWKEYKVPS